MNKHKKIFKSPLTSVLIVHTEELKAFVQSIDDFFIKEYYLLREKIGDIQQSLKYYEGILEEYKVENCERKKLVLSATKMMLSVKIKNLKNQEQMIISALNLEEEKLTKDIEKIMRKYALL